MGRRPEVKSEMKEEVKVKKYEPKHNVKIIDLTSYLEQANEESKTNPVIRPYLRAIEIIYQSFEVIDKIELKGIVYFVVKNA